MLAFEQLLLGRELGQGHLLQKTLLHTSPHIQGTWL
jgi:hypothetical protein